MLGASQIQRGASALVELRLAQAVAAIPGDRFVVRRLSPVETIGGGIVLDPEAPSLRGRPGAEALAALAVLETGSLGERLSLWIEQARDRGASEEDLARRAGVEPPAVREALAPAVKAGNLHPLRRSPDRYVGEAALARLAARASRELAALLSANETGVGPFARHLPSADPPGGRAAMAGGRGVGSCRPRSARDREVTKRACRERAFWPGLSANLPRASSRSTGARLEPAVAGRGGRGRPPPPEIVEGLITFLVKRGELVRLPGGWFIARAAIDDVATRLRGSGKSSLDVGEFKEMFGLTRKLAIPLLEHLDSTKVTRRVGDRREIFVPGRT